MNEPGLIKREVVERTETYVVVHELWDLTNDDCFLFGLPKWARRLKAIERKLIVHPGFTEISVSPAMMLKASR